MMWYAITYPCLRYLLLAQRSSYIEDCWSLINFNLYLYILCYDFISRIEIVQGIPDIKVHGAIMGPTWVLSAPGGSHVGPMNLAIRDISKMLVFVCITGDYTLVTWVCKNSRYPIKNHFQKTMQFFFMSLISGSRHLCVTMKNMLRMFTRCVNLQRY